MLTRGNKAGLVLAFLLGLTDIAILGALSDDDGPPIAIVVISVAIGVATLALVVRAWRSPNRPTMVAIAALRAVSALGVVGVVGEGTAAVVASATLSVLGLLSIYLLRSWLADPARRPLAQ